MPLISVYKNYHTHHHHPEKSEQLRQIFEMLAQMKEVIMALPKEVQDLLDQAKDSNSVLQSMEIHYNALATLVGTLQTSINDLKAGAVLSDADKQALVAQTSELAAVASTARADIATNTPLENQSVDPVNLGKETPAPAPAPAPADGSGAGSSTGTSDPSTDTTTTGSGT